MKAPAEAVLDLPGICPASASLAALTRPHPAATWETLRHDPAAVLFVLRHLPTVPNNIISGLRDDGLLLAAQELLRQPERPFVDWRSPGPDLVWRTARRQASLAEAIAHHASIAPDIAWTAGLLAPLGWIGLCAVVPNRIVELNEAGDFDQVAVARRLTRAWRLPSWLASIVSHLGLHVDLARRLGADPVLFQVTQLAVALTQRNHPGLRLPIGTSIPELLDGLYLTEEQVERLDPAPLDDTGLSFESPRSQPLLADLLRLTLENRTGGDRAWIERLNHELDHLHETLEQQIVDEKKRLLQQKLAALAELAGGAGHEINNPLAVISGQAQYLLKQLQTAEEQLMEDPSPALYLETLKGKFAKPLQTIVGQTQRIHQVLTGLMQFARPQPPRVQFTSIAKLFADVTAATRAFAEERGVRVVCPDVPAGLAANIDVGQMRVALGNLLRNAIEAVGPEGWASIRVSHEADGELRIVVEDNGPGLNAGAKEHLFDPFFSGRDAGRGRGLGLSTAWRLVSLQGGTLSLDPTAQGVTRFVATLPASEVVEDFLAPANLRLALATG